MRALRRELPDDREAATLGLAACVQGLNTSWRVGLPLDDVRAMFEEGRALARTLGDPVAEAYLSLVHARAVAGTGDVATYVDLAVQNERTALALQDETALAMARMWAVDALGFATRLPEAVRKADEVLPCIPRHVPAAYRILGFHPLPVVLFWLGYSLVYMGRLREGLDAVGRARRMADEDGTPELAAYERWVMAEAYRLFHDADRLLVTAQQVDEISRRLGEPAVLTGLAQFAYGHAHLAAGRATDAIEAARTSLRFTRIANKANEGMSTALLAEALLATGDLSAAHSAAEEAIVLCRRSLRGHNEAVAHGVLARALLRRDGAAARDAAESALANAATLIETTGAKAFAPALCEWRAELAAVLGDDGTRVQLLQEAQQGYDEIGAPLQAARIARELDA